MRTIAHRFTAPLFALLMAVSLAFGVTSVFAQAASEPCPIDYSSGRTGASCSVSQDCTKSCRMAFPGSPGGVCSFGCCICAY